MTLTNNLVGPRQHIRRNRQADLLGSFEIDHQLKFRWLLNRNVGGFCAFEHLIHEGGGAPVCVRIVSAVRDQSARFDPSPIFEYSWHSMFGEEVQNPLLIRVQHRIHQGEKTIWSFFRHHRKNHFEFVGVFIPRSCTVIPNGPATSWVAFASNAMPALPLFQTMATRESLGKISLSSSRRLGHRSEARTEMPVILPPGWARLATMPVPMGSLLLKKPMGIVFVVPLRAKIAAVPAVKIASIF